jgi:hypothetical protein
MMKSCTPIILLSLTAAGSLFAETSPFPEGMIPAIFAEDHEAKLAADLKADETAESTSETALEKLSPEAEAKLVTLQRKGKPWEAFLKSLVIR